MKRMTFFRSAWVAGKVRLPSNRSVRRAVLAEEVRYLAALLPSANLRWEPELMTSRALATFTRSPVRATYKFVQRPPASEQYGL